MTMRPKKMKKVRIIVLKSVVENLIGDLYQIGLVDIRKTNYAGLDAGRPLSTFDEVSKELRKMRTITSLMAANTNTKYQQKFDGIPGKKAILEAKNFNIAEHLKALSNETHKLSEEINTIKSNISEIQRLKHFKNVDFSKMRTKTLDYKIGTVPAHKKSTLSNGVDAMKGEGTIVNDPNSNIVLILYERSKATEMETVFSDSEFEELNVPAGTTTPAMTFNNLKSELDSKETRITVIKNQLKEISNTNIKKAMSILRALEIESERAGIASRFASSNRLYLLEGWVLADDYSKLDAVVARYDANVSMEETEQTKDEMPPTVLGNPKIVSPFEFLTKSYSLPNYFEIDPTLPYMIGLPIIYGMIVGDVIYGFLSIILGYILMKKFEKSYTMFNVSKIWVYSGIPTIIFGIIFDEWAGLSHMHLLNYFNEWVGAGLLSEPLYHGFHRMENILTLVMITALIGMVHLAAGFVIGAINEWHYNKKHALAKIAWIGVELGMLLALVGAIGLIDGAFMMAGIILLILSIIILGLTEGIIGIIELPGLLGNILSYTRIAAIGIVGIVIAELLNEFIIPLPEHGLVAIVLLPVFIILHIVNCFIAMFESLVQGGRLNIVEFRSKFLHGGGEIFTPFALKKD